MGTILRVNNLSGDTTAGDLWGLFKAVGTVAGAKISREEETGVSKGFGFVKMETVQAARSAVNALNGHTLKGRQIRVFAVRPPSEPHKPGQPPRAK